MKFLIAAGILVVVGFVSWGVYLHWTEVAPERAPEQRRRIVEGGGEHLSGMPASLEPALAEARRRGATGLREFLRQHRHRIQDPRLAWIELDYVVLLGGKDAGEARTVFARVKARVPEDSPVYPRVRELEATFGE